MDIGQEINKNGVAPSDPKLQALYQEYLQKSCEVGQIEYQLDQLDQQRLQLEKQRDVSRRGRNKAANEHRELQKDRMKGLKVVKDEAPAEAKLEMAEQPAVQGSPEPSA